MRCLRLFVTLCILDTLAVSQIISGDPLPQVKILNELFPVSNAQHISQITWTILGRTPSETVYCVSEPPVSQLRFVCIDCEQKNITDMVNVLNSAQDLTRNAGFPTVSLKNIDVNPNWTSVTIMCQAALNGGTIDSPPVTVNVEYLRSVRVMDVNGQKPVLIPNQGNVFYVECVRGPDGQCQQTGRRKTLHCSVQANPPPLVYRWLKNGEVTSGNGAEITIGTEMIGKSIQCSANNGLYSPEDMPTSQAVLIEPYSAAKVINTNFRHIQSIPPFGPNSRIEMNQSVKLACIVEGNPRPVIYWRMRRDDGRVTDAPCPQGYNGLLLDVTGPQNNNIMRMQGTCELHISDYSYSGQYWCSACSYVSDPPECSPSLNASIPADEALHIEVQGPPMESDMPPVIDLIGTHNALVSVYFCANPLPRPPREMVFNIDGHDIQLGQTWQNFRFDSITENNTHANCYFVRLQISPVHESDKSRQIMLKLQNQYGTKQITVNLYDLLGDGTGTSNMTYYIVFAVLALVAVSIGVAVLFYFCARRNLFCFGSLKEQQTFDGPQHVKAPMSGGDIYDGQPDSYYNGHGYESNYEALYREARKDAIISSV